MSIILIFLLSSINFFIIHIPNDLIQKVKVKVSPYLSNFNPNQKTIKQIHFHWKYLFSIVLSTFSFSRSLPLDILRHLFRSVHSGFQNSTSRQKLSKGGTNPATIVLIFQSYVCDRQTVVQVWQAACRCAFDWPSPTPVCRAPFNEPGIPRILSLLHNVLATLSCTNTCSHFNAVRPSHFALIWCQSRSIVHLDITCRLCLCLLFNLYLESVHFE